MALQNGLHLEAKTVCADIEKFIKNKVSELDRRGVILGLSGGIDSCVVAYLCARAVGPKNVTCLMLPEKHSSAENLKHAKSVAEKLGTHHQVEDLTRKLNQFRLYRLVPGHLPGFLVRLLRKRYKKHSLKKDESSFSADWLVSKNMITAKADAFYRIKHRMRMVTLYYYADSGNLLVAGAANKTEYLIGFFISYGCDNAADIMPIRHLYKTQVRQLAEYLGLPREIIDKPPSPDLLPGFNDEDLIGIPYEALDLILFGLEGGLSHEKIAAELHCGLNLVERASRLREKSRFKREIPYTLEL